ncbi:ribonuclease E/G, partial [Micromonospora sonneratiae]
MLENEPEGGERTGSQPAGDTAESADATPVRRARAARRRTSPPPTEPAQTGAPVEAPTVARSASGEAPEAEVLAPVAGDTEAAPKTTRRRRKATTADKKDATAPSGPTGEADLPAGPEAGPDPSAEAAPPVKATRTRRKKAVPAAARAEGDAGAAEPAAPTAAPEKSEAAGPAGGETGTEGGAAAP